MRFFFKSRQFKIILSITVCLLIIGILSAVFGSRLSPQSDLAGTVAAPFRTAFTKISQGVEDFFSTFNEGNEALIKNSELESEMAELRAQITDYEKIKKENEFYKNYLEIKENNPDFKFAEATLIFKEEKDPFKSFTLNKGSVNGVEKYDPVITDAGLVGYVSQVGVSTCKVTTILHPDITLGALDNRTSDSGVLYGDVSTAEKGMTGLYNLSRSCNVSVGDYIVTSGEGIFPEGLHIGTVRSIGSEKYNTSIYATVEPLVDFENLRDVMIITEFEGQGGLVPGK